jgi:3-methyl-2-oxobutanoate hydroxymethyltransferase
VLQDILGIAHGKAPSFSKNYLDQQPGIEAAISAYVTEVKNQIFPDDSHSFS